MGWEHKRRRVLIDPSFQGRLVWRVFLYCLGYLFAFTHVAFLYEVMSNMPAALNRGMTSLYVDYIGRQLPFFLASAFILPMLLYDLVKFSHRVAGPLHRCRKVMDAMAAGKPVSEFKARKHDLLREHVAALNALIRKWNARQGSAAPAAEPKGSSADTLAEEPVPANAGA
jgi:hypothetical protein